MKEAKGMDLIYNWLGDNKDMLLSKFIYKMINNRRDAEDFYQDLYVILGSKDLKKLLDIYKKGDMGAYVYIIIRNCLESSNSRYYYTYVKHTGLEYIEELDTRSEDLDNTEAIALLEEIDNDCLAFLDKVDNQLKLDEKKDPKAFYQREVFDMYYKEGYCYRDLSTKLKIPVRSLFNTVTRTRTELLDVFDEDVRNIKAKLIYYNKNYT